jgi:WD40 repeat protein/tetratricopeptide (TPR) repeat protein/tRNA A-37 threonylcarbamoyl transferase component Bud32
MPADIPYGPPSGTRLEAVLAEIQQAEEQGRTIDVQRYLDSFPDLADALRNYFRNREWFARVAPQLAPTAGRSAVVTPQPELPPGRKFANYEILKELGRGGMGIVYQVRQLSPEREVALKLIRTDRLADLPAEEQRQWLQRFRREAEVVASLEQHPNLVTLYEVGEHEGLPFFTMQLVRGGSLTETLRGGQWAVGGRELASQAARLVATVAQAVHHVHQRGVLHRDLKPGNILLDGHGRPLVSDFGLARRLDQSGSLVAGAVEGTAEYMAPEQARGLPGAVTTAADVYSLGAVLYALLTGRPPFKGANHFETLMLVIGQEPAPPRSLNPRVPRDLEIICLKCLEKEPGRRYASAATLADDLERWLAGRPINARPANTLERTWRWCRRNPVPTIATATVLAVVIAAFVLIADSRNKALSLAAEKGMLADANGELADANGKLAQRNGQLADEKAAEATRATTEAGRARQEEKRAQREAMRLAFRQATTLSDQGEVGRAMHALAHGLDLAERGGETDLEWLFRANLAAWRYHCHSLRRVLPHPAGVSALAWSPDGRTLAIACWDAPIRLWDVASGKPRGQPIKCERSMPPGTGLLEDSTGLVFSPDGQTLLTVGYSKVRVWQVETGQRVAELDHNPALVTSAAFAPDGHAILTGTTRGTAHLWDTSGKQLGASLLHPGWIEAVAFAPDGRFFATGDRQGYIAVWDVAFHQRVVTREHPGGVTALAFGTEGRVLSGGADRMARLWNLAGQSEPIVLAHQALVKAAAFSPDGSLALTGSLDRTARVWDATTGRPVGQPLVHPGEVLTVAFGPDGRTAATGWGRERGDARVWDLSLGNPLGGPLTHTASIVALAVSPDGKRVATASRDSTARLWDAHTGEPLGDGLQHHAEVNAVAFSPDSQTLVSGSERGWVPFWHAATGMPVIRESVIGGQGGQPGLRMKFQFSVGPSDASLFGGLGRGGLGREEKKAPGGSFWGPARGKSSGRRGGEEAAVFTVAFRPDGTKLVTAGRSGNAFLWGDLWGHEVRSMMALQERDPHGLEHPSSHTDLYAAAFSPDGRLLALGGEDGAVRLWDATKEFDEAAFSAKAKNAKREALAGLLFEATTPRVVVGPLQHGGEVVTLAFSPDGKLLLTGCSDGMGRLWDVATGQPPRVLKHQGAVVAVAFSPDGQTCVTGSWDGAARVWKTASGEQACPPLTHLGKVLAVAFCSDGRTVLTGSEDWTARLWDAATGQTIGPPLRHEDQVRSVVFRPDGRAAVTAGDDRVGRLWPVPAPAQGSASRIRDWVEARSGMRRLEDGSIQLLEVADWETTVARLGDWEAAAPEDCLGWNRQQARTAEAASQWRSTRWHLDRLLVAEPQAGPRYLRRGKANLAMRDLAAARRDFDRAVQLLPEEWETWFQRGSLASREGRWQDSIADMNKALERLRLSDSAPLRGQQPVGTAAILVGRGYAHAALGHWKEAADDLAVVRSPWEPSAAADWAAYALALLKKGDAQGYAAACRQMLAEFTKPQDEPKSTIVTSNFGRREVHTYGKPFDPQEAVTLAWVCCLVPDALPDYALPLRLAQQAATLDKNNYLFARAAGAALYRAKNYEAAVKQLEAAGTLRTQPSPSVWLLLAMAQQRCQRPDQAKSWLGKARDWIAQARDPKSTRASKDDLIWDRLPWTERLALELLQAEAEKLNSADAAKPRGAGR